MNKEPLGLYIVRFISGVGLFAMMCMLYWSSTLIEDDLKKMRQDLLGVKEELFSLRKEAEKGSVFSTHSNQERKERVAGEKPQASRYVDNALENLLKTDPFYEKTLPGLLGPGFKAQGTLHSAVLGRPENLAPFSQWAQVSAWSGQCNVSVGKMQFGKYETLAPDMAYKMEQRKNPKTGKIEFWVHLRTGVFWQPLKETFFSEQIHLAPHFLKKHPVTAKDFKFRFDAMMNPYVQAPGAIAERTYYSDVEEIEVIDDQTFVVRWKNVPFKKEDGTAEYKVKYSARFLTAALSPLASFLYQYFADASKIIEDENPEAYRTSSVWAQNFAHHFAKNIIPSCGPWIFEGFSDRQIKFKKNPDYYLSLDPLIHASEVDIKDGTEVMWQSFKANRLAFYSLNPSQLLEWEQFKNTGAYQEQAMQKTAIERLDYLNRAYTFIGWNAAKPFFKSRKVRQAMTMGIDRKRIIEQNLNGLGIELTGPFFPSSSEYDPSIEPWPYDPIAARKALEEEGWFDSDGDGIIDKEIDGKKVPFAFHLTYYVKNQTTKAICEYIASALSKLGVRCNLKGVDIADVSSAFDDKDFDAIFLAWALPSPPSDPKQLWHSSGSREKGSSNAIGFENKEIDAIIEVLQYEDDKEKRKNLYHRFAAIIHEEAPYTFLYVPKVVFLYREYLKNVFIPSERQDLIPGANVAEPESSIFYLRQDV